MAVFANNKAYVAGTGAAIASPIGQAIAFGLTAAGLPETISTPLGAVLAGLLIGLFTWFVPNIPPDIPPSAAAIINQANKS